MFLLVAAALAAPTLLTEALGADLGDSPSLVHAQGQWWLYACEGGSVTLHTSADARTWTDAGVAYAPSTVNDSEGACPASVLADAGIDGHDWGMWYAATADDGTQTIMLATSDDGRAWSPWGVAWACGKNPCGAPVAMRVGKYHLWVHTEADDNGGTRLRVHKSEDGTTWSSGLPFVLPGGETEIDIAYMGGGYRVLASNGAGAVLYEGVEIEGEMTEVARLDNCQPGGVALARDPDGIVDNTADFLGLVTGPSPVLLTGVSETESLPCAVDTWDSGIGGGEEGCGGCGGSALLWPLVLIGRRERAR